MGNTGFSPLDYTRGVDNLRAAGVTFKRSRDAASSGVYAVADILNPRQMKGGVRECCFAPGFDDALAVFVSIDGTGSMGQVPGQLQTELPKFFELITERGISDRPNVLFACHDDEHALPPDAAFQMSQFETAAAELLQALNELVIPQMGGGNSGEAYHLSFYAAANHTRLEAYERDGTKGFFFMICDEQPFYDAGDPATNGTSPAIAKEVFGDMLQHEVTMLDSVRKTFQRYHVFVIRPGHTSNGKNRSITHMWQELLRQAGENPQHVLEVDETEAIVPTMALTVGQILGENRDELIDVLRGKGTIGLESATRATQALVPVSHGRLLTAVGKASATLTKFNVPGRRRR